MSESNRGDRVSGIKYVKDDRIRDMQAFDRLPPRLRKAVREAPANFAVVGIAGELAKGRKPRQVETDILLTAKEFVEKAYAECGFVPPPPRGRRA